MDFLKMGQELLGDKMGDMGGTGIAEKLKEGGLGDQVSSWMQVMPSLMDKMSSGGSLLDSLGEGGNPVDMAKKLFGQ